MRMYTDGCIYPIEFFSDFHRTDRGFLVNTHAHHFFDAFLSCTLNNVFEIALIGAVVQMAMAVKKYHAMIPIVKLLEPWLRVSNEVKIVKTVLVIKQ